jgi:hypothetical protein
MHGTMTHSDTHTSQRTDMRTPLRNRYHFGQLLGVEQFVLETDYFNHKRWLLNRLVSGYGVVCGLDVKPGQSPNEIVVTPGVAIDKWGREIIVVNDTQPIAIPGTQIERGAEIQHDRQQQQQYQKKGSEDRAHAWVQVVICYRECESDPVPVMAGDCHACEPCAPSTIREVYSVEFRPGPAPWPACDCRIPEALGGGGIDHAVLARWVTYNCPEVAEDPCIPLANIRIIDPDEGHRCDEGNIDIRIRPIVYTNDLLYELLVCMAGGPGADRRWK